MSSCGLWECRNQAKIKTKLGGGYCSEACARKDSKERGFPFQLENQTDLSGTEVGSARSAQSLNQETTTELAPQARSGAGKNENSTKMRLINTESSLAIIEPESESYSETGSELATVPATQNITRPEVSGSQLPTLEPAVLMPSSLIDESMKELKGLMSFVADSVQARRAESPVLSKNDPHAINAACNCAKQIAELMKIKVVMKKEGML